MSSATTLNADQHLRELKERFATLESLAHKREKEILRLRAQLAQAGKLATLGLQGAGIAHELNNPLTVISAEADDLLDALEEGLVEPSHILHSAKNIKSFAERMRVLIDHIRQYSREDKRANWTAISLNDPIRDSLLMMRRQLETSGIRVLVTLDDNLPKIWGQYNKLESVFQNLISNARDALEAVTDDREKKVEIISEAPDNEIVIKIRDNGCGMSKDVLQKIYSPFYTTKGKEDGTGIGLSITHNIVKEHHGTILVNSHPGQGTAFTLKFPLERRNRVEVQKVDSEG